MSSKILYGYKSECNFMTIGYIDSVGYSVSILTVMIYEVLYINSNNLKTLCAELFFLSFTAQVIYSGPLFTGIFIVVSFNPHGAENIFLPLGASKRDYLYTLGHIKCSDTSHLNQRPSKQYQIPRSCILTLSSFFSLS